MNSTVWNALFQVYIHKYINIYMIKYVYMCIYIYTNT